MNKLTKVGLSALCGSLASVETSQAGTMEVLLTKPISLWNVVMSKYLAANVLVLVAIVPTLIYFASIYFLGEVVGNLDVGGILGSYLGLFMLSSAFIAIGIFASTISTNQVVAFLIAIVCNVIIYYRFIHTFWKRSLPQSAKLGSALRAFLVEYR